MTPLPHATGFEDPVRDSQRVFRALMGAMARPGSLGALAVHLVPPPGLPRGLATLALAVVDHETPVWLDAGLSASRAVADYLRFHTGAPLAADPAMAAFALVRDPSGLPPFERFALGTPDYPDRSTTLLIAVDHLEAAAGWRLTGPGIETEARLVAAPLPSDFFAKRRALAPLFPRGLDLVFATQDHVAALPRTTRLEA